MAATQHDKLTELLKGKSISGTSDSGGEKTISFTDGSKLTAKVVPSSSNSASTGGAVEAVHLSSDPATLSLHLEGGSTVEIPLVGASSSLSLKDKDGAAAFEN
ncbi:MAG: hypothetical protein V4671_28530 [Armatimonadota bacterium]